MLLSDRGGEFRSAALQHVLRCNNVQYRYTSGYYPQTNGRCERLNRTLKTMMAKLVGSKAHKWEEVLPKVLAAYRTSVSTVTGFTPFYLHFGRHPRHGAGMHHVVPPGQVERVLWDRVDQLAQAHERAREGVRNQQVRNKSRLDQRPQAPEYVEGQPVLLQVINPTTFQPHYDHGYIVTRVRGSVITVVGPKLKRLNVNASRLKPAPTGFDVGKHNIRMTRGHIKKVQLFGDDGRGNGSGSRGLEWEERHEDEIWGAGAAGGGHVQHTAPVPGNHVENLNVAHPIVHVDDNINEVQQNDQLPEIQNEEGAVGGPVNAPVRQGRRRRGLPPIGMERVVNDVYIPPPVRAVDDEERSRRVGREDEKKVIHKHHRRRVSSHDRRRIQGTAEKEGGPIVQDLIVFDELPSVGGEEDVVKQKEGGDSETERGEQPSNAAEGGESLVAPAQKRRTRELRNLLDDQKATGPGWDRWLGVLKAREEAEIETGIRKEVDSELDQLNEEDAV